MQSRMSMVSGKWQKLYLTSKVDTHCAQYTSVITKLSHKILLYPHSMIFSLYQDFFFFYKRIKSLMKPNSNFYNHTFTNSKWRVQKVISTVCRNYSTVPCLFQSPYLLTARPLNPILFLSAETLNYYKVLCYMQFWALHFVLSVISHLWVCA